MHIHDYSRESSLLSSYISELRDQDIQKDRMRFRRNLERIGEILGYEMSKVLPYKSEAIQTPLGVKECQVLDEEPVVCSILRAGIPLHQGLLNYFDKAGNTFISAYRHHPDGGKDFEIVVEYLATPSLEGKVLVLADPMLATGSSMVAVYEALKKCGTPREIHIVSVVGSKEGVQFVQENFPAETHLWIATVDEELNDHGYIIPGLGDAGDLAYGEKMEK